MWSKFPETASCFRGSPINKARESLLLTFVKKWYIIIPTGAHMCISAQDAYASEEEAALLVASCFFARVGLTKN